MNAVGGSDIRIATAGEIEEMMGENGFEAEKGFIGPQGLKKYGEYEVTVVADETVKNMKNFVIGINQKDKHGVGYNWGGMLNFQRLLLISVLLKPANFVLSAESRLRLQEVLRLETFSSSVLSIRNR